KSVEKKEEKVSSKASHKKAEAPEKALAAEEKEEAKEAKAHEKEHLETPEKGHEKAHSEKEEHRGKKTLGKGPFEWVEYKPKEIEEVIVNLANSGNSASEIGLILRDQYGIPGMKKFSGETLQKVLAKHSLLPEVPEDLLSLLKKSVKLEKHMVQNKHDMTAKRGHQLTVSKIRRLQEYYHRTKKLSKDWYYSPERAALLIK
ncbi:MAG: 30S ribosomal protein S15, partial [archaeon]|nr:30S ribosomal protein S15 [archaeon]